MSGKPRFNSIFRPGLFDEQVILVTGGGTGIGRCIAHELAFLGGTVIITGRRDGPLQQVAGEIAEAGGKADCAVPGEGGRAQTQGLERGRRHQSEWYLVGNTGGLPARPS